DRQEHGPLPVRAEPFDQLAEVVGRPRRGLLLRLLAGGRLRDGLAGATGAVPRPGQRVGRLGRLGPVNLVAVGARDLRARLDFLVVRCPARRAEGTNLDAHGNLESAAGGACGRGENTVMPRRGLVTREPGFPAETVAKEAIS